MKRKLYVISVFLLLSCIVVMIICFFAYFNVMKNYGFSIFNNTQHDLFTIIVDWIRDQYFDSHKIPLGQIKYHNGSDDFSLFLKKLIFVLFAVSLILIVLTIKFKKSISFTKNIDQHPIK